MMDRIERPWNEVPGRLQTCDLCHLELKVWEWIYDEEWASFEYCKTCYEKLAKKAERRERD